MQEAYSARELAPVIGVSGEAVRQRALKDGWANRRRAGKRGRPELEYLAASLPEDVRAALAAAEAREAARLPAPAGKPPAVAGQVMRLEDYDEKRRSVALARVDLVRLYLDWLERAPEGGKTPARDQFILAYQGGAWPRLKGLLGEVSWKTVEAWKLKMRAGGVPALAEQRGLRAKGKSSLTPAMAEILVASALHPGAPNISEVLRRAHMAMQARCIECDLSDRQLRRFIENFMRTNWGDWVFTREGKKAWEDKAAFFIERDYDRLQVGDIAVADGHVLNFETLNPWTGRAQRMELVVWYDMKANFPMGWEVMPTENIQSIAAAFRRSVLRLGKVPLVAYLDNGRAFRAQYFQGTDFGQSGIDGMFTEVGVRAVIHAWPYHGQSKTIERFFGTFGELERWVPSYTGTSIETKPPRLKRGERLHNKIYEAAGGRPLTLLETHTAIAWWFDEYASRPQRGHLKGRTPLEVFEAGRGDGVNAADLRHMMMAREVKTINRNGISHLGHNYYHPELYNRKHQVDVRYDLHDDSYVMIQLPDGRWITATRNPKIHPAAHVLGTDADRQALEAAIARKRDQERLAGEIGLPVSLSLAVREGGAGAPWPLSGGARFARLIDEAAVRRAFMTITSAAARQQPEASVAGCLVQAATNVPRGGFELAVGFTRDPQFGPLLSFGQAGIGSELLGDTSYRLAPLTPEDAREMLREVRFYPLLRGVQGGAVVPLEALERLLLALSRLALRAPRLAGAQLGPVLAGAQGVFVAGARLTLA